MLRRRKAAPKGRARVSAGKKGEEWEVVYTKSRHRVDRIPLYGRGVVGREAAQVAARRHNARC